MYYRYSYRKGDRFTVPNRARGDRFTVCRGDRFTVDKSVIHNGYLPLFVEKSPVQVSDRLEGFTATAGRLVGSTRMPPSAGPSLSPG